MRISLILALAGTIGLVGCVGTLPVAPSKVTAANVLETIGAPGGYRVRNVAIPVPDLSCGGRAYPETRDAFVGGFKRAYAASWNAALDAKRLGVLTPRTASETKRRDYLSSHFIRSTKDAQDAAHEYETKTTRITLARSPYAGSPAEREEYRRAACIRDAYTKGSTQGGRQGDDDVRTVLDKVPPDN